MRYEKPKVEVIHFSQPGFFVSSWSYFATGRGFGIIACSFVKQEGNYNDSFHCYLVRAVDITGPGHQPQDYSDIEFSCPTYYGWE